MEPSEACERDKRLLVQMIGPQPPGATDEEHREAITSLLALFERFHVESGAARRGG
jgi:alkylhydroperoxidase/carboxymuconolactone decarboxylase family protein YurZ